MFNIFRKQNSAMVKPTNEIDSKGLMHEIEEPVNEACIHFYAWVERVVTLASGALTLLVALQKSYVSQSSKYLVLLAICWACFCASIMFGLLVLYGRHRSLSALVKITIEKYNGTERDSNSHIPHFYYAAMNLMVLSFLLAIISLTAFASANLNI